MSVVPLWSGGGPGNDGSATAAAPPPLGHALSAAVAAPAPVAAAEAPHPPAAQQGGPALPPPQLPAESRAERAARLRLGLHDQWRTAPDGLDFVKKQQRWLLFLQHCAKCRRGNGQCRFQHACLVGKELWGHMLRCNKPGQCSFPRCNLTRDLLKHHLQCQDSSQKPRCPICVPVRDYIKRQKEQAAAAKPSTTPVIGPAPRPAVTSDVLLAVVYMPH